MALTREQVLAKAAEPGLLKREAVDCPELGGEVFVSQFDGAARDEWEQWCVDHARGPDGKPKRFIHRSREALIAFSVVDETGVRMFSLDDLDALAKLPAIVLDRLAEVSQRLNGIGREAVEDAKKN